MIYFGVHNDITAIILQNLLKVTIFRWFLGTLQKLKKLKTAQLEKSTYSSRVKSQIRDVLKYSTLLPILGLISWLFSGNVHYSRLYFATGPHHQASFRENLFWILVPYIFLNIAGILWALVSQAFSKTSKNL